MRASERCCPDMRPSSTSGLWRLSPIFDKLPRWTPRTSRADMQRNATDIASVHDTLPSLTGLELYFQQIPRLRGSPQSGASRLLSLQRGAPALEYRAWRLQKANDAGCLTEFVGAFFLSFPHLSPRLSSPSLRISHCQLLLYLCDSSI